MVRTYKRKTTKGSYPQEILEAAIEAVRSGKLSGYKAAAFYKIPRTTIMDRISNKRGQLGRRPTLPEYVEQNLLTCLRTFQNYGFELTPDDVMNIIARYVKRNALETPFKDGKPGKEWMFSFQRRHKFCVEQEASSTLSPETVFVKTEVENED